MVASARLHHQQTRSVIMAPADPLQCPRCSSSNTKFCYYNNYSLSQPRHFCKACKRYWTRGGTLRNVPVGGGYRKNKKFKRHSPLTAVAAPPNPTINNNNPFIYKLPTNFPFGLNFPFQETRVSSDSPRLLDVIPRTNRPEVGLSSCFWIGYEQNSTADFGSSNFAQHHESNLIPSLVQYEDLGMVVGNGQIGKEYSNIMQYSNQIEQIHSEFGVWLDPFSSAPSSMI